MEWCTDCWLPIYDAESEAAANPRFPWCECPAIKTEEPIAPRD